MRAVEIPKGPRGKQSDHKAGLIPNEMTSPLGEILPVGPDSFIRASGGRQKLMSTALETPGKAGKPDPILVPLPKQTCIPGCSKCFWKIAWNK